MSVSKKILIIDDEEYIANMLELNLKEIGYDCRKCTTTQEGIKTAQEYIPDLIIMDIMMPNIDGLEATKILKNNKLTRNIPILILSAKSTEEDLEEARLAGADGFICKPILPQKLIKQINAILDK